MGRKKKKAADKRSAYVRVMLTEKELAEIAAAASAVGADVSAWVRTEILKMLRKKT